MRIITRQKAKDYWHYLQGIYGIDPLLTYDLREAVSLRLQDESMWNDVYPELFEIAFCNELFFFVVYNRQVYHSPEELLDVGLKFQKSCYYIHETLPRTLGDATIFYKRYNNINTGINKEKRKPVLFRSYGKEWHEVLKLSDFNFHRIKDAHTVYTEVGNFLGWLKDNPPLPDKQTNVEKIVSHGFDKKTSFRPKMK